MSAHVVQGRFPFGLPHEASASRVATPYAWRPSSLPTGFGRHAGQPLQAAVREDMETLFETKFSDVRIHVGLEPRAIGALAFTMGSTIYFGPGQFNPTTLQGKQLLAHELTHVVQQRAGRVRNPLGYGIAVVQDRALEAEANRMGQRAATRQLPHVVQRRPYSMQQSVAADAARGSLQVAAITGGQRLGSVMVRPVNNNSIELTDLGVDASHRKQGLGMALMASALESGLQLGRSDVTLASQDTGNGHLTNWYKDMGFTQVGVDRRGYPRLQAPIRRVLNTVAQRRRTQQSEITVVQRSANPSGSSLRAIPHPTFAAGVIQRAQTELAWKCSTRGCNVVVGEGRYAVARPDYPCWGCQQSAWVPATIALEEKAQAEPEAESFRPTSSDQHLSKFTKQLTDSTRKKVHITAKSKANQVGSRAFVNGQEVPSTNAKKSNLSAVQTITAPDRSAEVNASTSDGEVDILIATLESFETHLAKPSNTTKQQDFQLALYGPWGACDGCKKRIDAFFVLWAEMATQQMQTGVQAMLTLTYKYLNEATVINHQEVDLLYGWESDVGMLHTLTGSVTGTAGK